MLNITHSPTPLIPYGVIHITRRLEYSGNPAREEILIAEESFPPLTDHEMDLYTKVTSVLSRAREEEFPLRRILKQNNVTPKRIEFILAELAWSAYENNPYAIIVKEKLTSPPFCIQTLDSPYGTGIEPEFQINLEASLNRYAEQKKIEPSEALERLARLAGNAWRDPSKNSINRIRRASALIVEDPFSFSQTLIAYGIIGEPIKRGIACFLANRAFQWNCDKYQIQSLNG